MEVIRRFRKGTGIKEDVIRITSVGAPRYVDELMSYIDRFKKDVLEKDGVDEI